MGILDRMRGMKQITPHETAGNTIHALFKTNLGEFRIKLFYDLAPKTCTNFIDLAEGNCEWVNPETSQVVRGPFYDGLIFHRVIPRFMIQGGCPLGQGTGGPGYKFADEFHPKARHARKGVLSMANSGPGTNGSQFFITVAATPHLDDRHSVFGEVSEGMEIVESISRVPTGRHDKPIEDVVLEAVVIERS